MAFDLFNDNDMETCYRERWFGLVLDNVFVSVSMLVMNDLIYCDLHYYALKKTFGYEVIESEIYFRRSVVNDLMLK